MEDKKERELKKKKNLKIKRKFGKKKKVISRNRKIGLGFKTPREVCVFHVFACWWVVAAWLVMGEDCYS
jgi:hypothetical protein